MAEMNSQNQEPAAAALAAAPSLLVPINVQALVSVQSYMGSQDNWAIAPMNYSSLANFGSPEPPPLTHSQILLPGGLPWTGVILHWALPDALTHGTQPVASPTSSPGSQSDVTFPHVPNRWMVIRTSMDPNHPNDPNSRITRVWVLQSGYQDWASNLPAGNSFNYDFTQAQEIYLGQSWLLSTAPPAGSTTATEIPLQAIGPGDATFAAYIANINNVFSFRDDLMSDFPQPNLSVPDAWIGQSSPPEYPGLPLTYLVAGWYSDPTQDPLYHVGNPTDWAKVMKTLMWSVDQPAANPTQTLCHGAVYGVNWLGHAGEVQSGIPTQTELPLVAVGNTSVEALAAMIEYQINQQPSGPGPVTGAAVAEILEAFQYNLLSFYDQPGGVAKIDNQKHQACFGSAQGGTLWDVVVSPTPPDAPPPPTNQPPPALTSGQSAQLQQLNALQQEYDQLSRQLESERWDLFSAWWKLLYLSAEGSSQYYLRMARQAYLSLKTEVQNQQQALQAVLNGTESVLGLEQVQQELIQSLGTTFQLVKKDAGRFWHPVDPVVLICGAKGSFKHGSDHLYTDDGTLFCRVTGQTISSMTVAGGSSTAVVTSDDLVPPSSQNPFAVDPQTSALLNPPMDDILALFKEVLLLDTTNAMMIAQAAIHKFNPPDNSISPQSLAPAIVAQQNSIWNFTLHDALNKQTAADHPDFNGMIPSKNCIEFWSPPWSPLYLDWSVEWLPAWTDTGHLLDSWQFGTLSNGKQMDYSWASATQPDPTNGGATFQGRTLLTPKAAEAFAARLEQFLEHVDPSLGVYPPPLASDGSPEFNYLSSPPQEVSQALGEVMQMISNWDLLSQSLSGLHQQLIMRNPDQHIPVTNDTLTGLLNSGQLQPGETVAELLSLMSNADTALPMPQVELVHRRPPPYTPAPPPAYNPLRAGHFVITNLWVVDDFGQVYSIFSATESQPYLRPVISQWLQTPQPGSASNAVSPGVVQLPPRIVQPARLSLTLISATDQSVETTSDPLTNPVCGWVLPNHLDNGLTIYAADGSVLGEMVLTGGEQNRRVRWEPPPDSAAPVGAPPDIANEHLRDFVMGLLGQNDGGAAFMDFMDVIDATLWTIDPLGGRSNQSLSVLIGRPLALVRARVKLELQGHPVYDESWANMGQRIKCWPYPPDTGQSAPPDFTATSFKIHLGSLELRDDGLLGYFLNGNYQQFISVHAPVASASPPETYVVQHDFQLTLNSDVSSPPNESLAYVTMLMDPRGSVHASTGILPVKSVVVPGEYVEKPLSRMEVTFRIGPVLTDAEKLRMPLPSISRGDWTWIRHTGVTVWQAESDITPSSPTPRLSDIPLSVREGWLKLSSLLDDDKK